MGGVMAYLGLAIEGYWMDRMLSQLRELCPGVTAQGIEIDHGMKVAVVVTWPDGSKAADRMALYLGARSEDIARIFAESFERQRADRLTA